MHSPITKPRRVRCSIQGIAFSGSIQGQGSLPDPSCSSRSAMPRSARYKAGQENAAFGADHVGNHRAVSQFEVKGRPDQLLRDLEKVFRPAARGHR